MGIICTYYSSDQSGREEFQKIKETMIGKQFYLPLPSNWLGDNEDNEDAKGIFVTCTGVAEEADDQHGERVFWEYKEDEGENYPDDAMIQMEIQDHLWMYI